MLPAISSFLSSAVKEPLEKLLRPATLAAAAHFVFLNLVLILLPAQRLESSFGSLVSAVLNLDATWLTLVVTLLTLVLGYVLSALDSTIYRFMTGESWENIYFIGFIARTVQKLRWKLIQNGIDQISDPEDPIRKRLTYELRTQFPDDASYIASTALGNVLNANAYILWKRHSIDLTALWPHMQVAIHEKKPIKELIDNEKAGLDFLLILSFVIVVFVIESLVFRILGLTVPPLQSWHYLIFLLLAYAIYRSGVVKAAAWGQAILMAFDQEQGTLREKLSMQKFENRKVARQHWELLSQHILYGYGEEQFQSKIDHLFDEPKKSETSATVTASPNVSIIFQQEKVNLPEPITEEFILGQRNYVHHYSSEIRYSILVGNVLRENVDFDSWPKAQGVFVIVDEPQTLSIDKMPTGGLDWNVYKIAPKRLLWQLKRNLRANETVKLEYTLPIVIWVARSNQAGLKIDSNPRHSSISKEGQNYHIKLTLIKVGLTVIADGKIDVFHSLLLNHSDYIPPEDIPGYITNLNNPTGYRFNLPTIEASDELPVLDEIINWKPKEDSESK